MKHVLILFMTLVLAGCVAQPVAAAQEAHDALVNFLTLLHTQNYKEPS